MDSYKYWTYEFAPYLIWYGGYEPINEAIMHPKTRYRITYQGVIQFEFESGLPINAAHQYAIDVLGAHQLSTIVKICYEVKIVMKYEFYQDLFNKHFIIAVDPSTEVVSAELYNKLRKSYQCYAPINEAINADIIKTIVSERVLRLAHIVKVDEYSAKKANPKLFNYLEQQL